MNKLFSKIAALSVGLAMAVGVGVAVGSKSAKVVKAGSGSVTINSISSNTDGVVTVVPSKASGSNAPITGSYGVRLYANNTVTITCSNNITSLTIHWTKNSNKTFATVTADVGTYTHPSAAGDGTWTGSAKEIVLTVGSSGQIQFNSVSYEAEGSTASYTITYDGNGGTGTMSSSTNTVSECEFTAPEGKEFSTWNTEANGSGDDYAPGAIATSDLDLFAIWRDKALGGTINFGSATGSTKINATHVTGTDSGDVEWTIDTVMAEESFSQNASYSQVGASAKPATSITFTATLSAAMKVVAFSAKFGGFSNTAGDVALMVDGTSIGSGSLNATTDVVVEATDKTQSGTTLSITVTNIAKGVKVYYISYELESAVDPSLKNMTIKTSGSAAEGTSHYWSKTADIYLFTAEDDNGAVSNVTWSVSDAEVATIKSTGRLTTVKPGSVVIYAEAEGYNKASANVSFIKGATEELAVTGTMTKSSYSVGESWSHEGLVATATFHSGWEEDVSSEATWTYNPTSPALGVTSVVATATYDEISASSSAQTVTVTKTNQIQQIYTKASGASVDVYGYYVGFLDGTGPVIMDGEYGVVIYDKSADVSGYTEKETILHVTGSVSIYKGLYEIGSATMTVATSVPEESVPATPVVYATKGTETADYASRLTTVTGTATVTSGSFDNAAGTADIKMNFAVGTQTVQVFYKKAAQTADADAFAAMKAAVAGSTEITIKGFTGWYDGFQVQMNGYIPAAQDYTAEDFAQDLLDQTDAVCAGWTEGKNNHDALEAIWSDLASNDKYPSLPSDQKQILAEAARNPSGTVVEQAMARYDYLTGKYDLSNFINGREPVHVVRLDSELNIADHNTTMIIVIAIAATSAVALSLLLVLKKRKHN